MKKLNTIAAVTFMGITMAVTSTHAFAAEMNAAVPDMTGAVNTVLADAGLTEDAVTFTRKLNEYQDGTETFEIDFVVPSEMKYEYKIDARNGMVIERETEPWDAEDDFEYRALLEETTNFFDLDNNENAQLIENSKMNAQKEAGISDSADYHYYKTGMDYDDGRVLCKIGLLVPGEQKYDFAFDARTGNLFQSETDFWEAEDDLDFAALLQDADTGTGQEMTANTGEVTDAVAKQIALDDAGFAESEVRIEKCNRDFDDGVELFEVSFIASNGMEYDYEINAADGRILSKESDFDD